MILAYEDFHQTPIDIVYLLPLFIYDALGMTNPQKSPVLGRLANFEFGVSMTPATHASGRGLTPALSCAADTPDYTMDSSS